MAEIAAKPLTVGREPAHHIVMLNANRAVVLHVIQRS
jgi:hypothetical protein